MATNDTPQLHGQGSLSERELQIVELVASGLTNQEISEKLEISKRTVDNHISKHIDENRHGQSGGAVSVGSTVGQGVHRRSELLRAARA